VSGRRRTKGNSLYIHRPAYAEVRDLILGGDGPGRAQRVNAAGTFFHLLLWADDPEGTICMSDRAIAARLGFGSRNTWLKHRAILIGCGVLAATEQLWTNQHDEKATYIIPLFGKIRGLHAGSESEPPIENGGSLGGSVGGSLGGSESGPARPLSPADSLPDPQDPQDPQDLQDKQDMSSSLRSEEPRQQPKRSPGIFLKVANLAEKRAANLRSQGRHLEAEEFEKQAAESRRRAEEAKAAEAGP
jgi:hypothetical protein